MDDRRGDAGLEDAHTCVRTLITEVDGLDDPANERRFVEAVARATDIDPTKVIFITDSGGGSRDSLSERVFLPATADENQIEVARHLLGEGDALRDTDLSLDESGTQRSASSLQARVRDQIDGL